MFNTCLFSKDMLNLRCNLPVYERLTNKARQIVQYIIGRGTYTPNSVVKAGDWA